MSLKNKVSKLGLALLAITCSIPFVKFMPLTSHTGVSNLMTKQGTPWEAICTHRYRKVILYEEASGLKFLLKCISCCSSKNSLGWTTDFPTMVLLDNTSLDWLFLLSFTFPLSCLLQNMHLVFKLLQKLRQKDPLPT